MERDGRRMELCCSACAWRVSHDTVGIAQWLRASGRLRSHSEAMPDELRELALALAPRQPCPHCGVVGLAVRPTDDDEADWPDARRCEECGSLIPAERLEVFPGASLCAACQAGEERGEPAATGEFCAKCGSPLVVRLSRGAGIRRYTLVCSNNPPCR